MHSSAIYNFTLKHCNDRFNHVCNFTAWIKLCGGQLFSNIIKIMLFISDVQYYIPLKLCKTAGHIHLFKITGMITVDKIKLNKHLCMGHFGDRLE